MRYAVGGEIGVENDPLTSGYISQTRAGLPVSRRHPHPHPFPQIAAAARLTSLGREESEIRFGWTRQSTGCWRQLPTERKGAQLIAEPGPRENTEKH
jgi:hypothetical protein